MDFQDNNYEEIFQNFLRDSNLDDNEFTERQWQILNAAIKVFSQNGYGSSRTSEIAKEADVAEGTIFRYYKTKKDLLMGLIIPFATRFMRPFVLESAIKIMENSENKTIDEVLRELIADRIDLVRKNLPLIKTVLVEASYQPELLNILKEEIISKAFPVIKKFIGDYVAKSEIRDMEPSFILRSIISTIGGYIFLSSVFPEYFAGDGDKKEVDKLVDILLNGIKKK
ncbi:TetR/AcrR family transcriptional regulator [Clostridium sp. WILCCON 0269]|uniref:TetR/AcrR family transcriptional regulator n=1 Tax=Candidatus Clostridium eludens TaxID=3381663 RepID=A0ABW8SG79_9CLOT